MQTEQYKMIKPMYEGTLGKGNVCAKPYGLSGVCLSLVSVSTTLVNHSITRVFNLLVVIYATR